MAKSSTRRINIYINGKEVEATVKSIRSEMNKLINEQNRMVVGSDQYIAHAKKIQTLRGYLQEHSQNIGAVANSWDTMQRKMMLFGAGRKPERQFQEDGYPHKPGATQQPCLYCR